MNTAAVQDYYTRAQVEEKIQQALAELVQKLYTPSSQLNSKDFNHTLLKYGIAIIHWK
jgi:hypothetical protein